MEFKNYHFDRFNNIQLQFFIKTWKFNIIVSKIRIISWKKNFGWLEWLQKEKYKIERRTLFGFGYLELSSFKKIPKQLKIFHHCQAKFLHSTDIKKDK